MGAEVEKLQTKARQQAANLLRVHPDEMIFTSGGTEGNNLAIKGVAFEYKRRGNHIITTEIEHPSVYETCKALEEFRFHVTYLPDNQEGVVEIEQVEAAITDDTILLSMMAVNKENGSIQAIQDDGELLKDYQIVMVDDEAVQEVGKVCVNLKEADIVLDTISGQKILGVYGTGILVKKRVVVLYTLLHGGIKVQGIRHGKENVA